MRVAALSEPVPEEWMARGLRLQRPDGLAVDQEQIVGEAVPRTSS